MRIGIDASNISGEGGARHLYEILKVISENNLPDLSVTVWCSPALQPLLPSGATVEIVAQPQVAAGLMTRLLWQRFTAARLTRHKIDLLWVVGGVYFGCFRPFVTMSRNMLPFEWRELRRYGFSRATLRLLLLRACQSWSFKRADGVIFLSAYARRVIEDELHCRTKARALIAHGVDPSLRLAPRPQPPLSDYSEQRPIKILYVSTIDVYKHSDKLVRGVALLRARGWPVTLQILGQPTNQSAVARLDAACADVDPRREYIDVVGGKSLQGVTDYYHGADIFAYASSCENFPNVILEAMASGLPIASSQMGPMPEILQDAALFFDPEEPTSIAQALTQLIESPSLRRQLAARAFELSHAYSWERCAEETLAFLKQIAASTSIT